MTSGCRVRARPSSSISDEMFSALDSGLTGPLFATEAMRACFSDGARLGAMLRMQAALARAHGMQGLAEAIEGIGVERLDFAAIGAATAVAGVPTIPFLKMVQDLLPDEAGRGLHRGATTQDVLDTALALQCAEAFALLAGGLDGVLAGLMGMAVRYRAAACVGRTFGQHAAPVTFGFKAAVWLAGVAEVAARLPEVRGRMLVASLGGPVGILAGLGEQGPVVLEKFAGALGLGVTSVAWHVRRGRVAETGAWLAQLVGALGKMATDVAHLCSTEVGEVAEPYAPGRGGSSAMPHKRNPVSCTVILAAHGVAPGLAAGLLGAMAGAHERPPGLWHGEWHALPQLFGLASGALREGVVLAEGLEVDVGRMEENLGATRGLLFADAAAGLLAGAMGRAAAHHLVEEAAGEVRRTGVGLAEVLAQQGHDVGGAFDTGPAVRAAWVWVDRAVDEAGRVRDALKQEFVPCR